MKVKIRQTAKAGFVVLHWGQVIASHFADAHMARRWARRHGYQV